MELKFSSKMTVRNTPLQLPNKTIYFDNAATSFPKPSMVVDAMNNFMLKIGANPGRSGHQLAYQAGDILHSAREGVARLLHVKNPMRVCFTYNATFALNQIIKGLVKKGDRVITSSFEHNSTIRPLKQLADAKIISLTISTNLEDDLQNKQFDHCIINHCSNSFGHQVFTKEIGQLCKQKGVTVVVDGAQSFAAIPVNLNRDGIDLFAFSGHKSLLGPMGIGAIVLSDSFDENRLMPLIAGGTGSRSDSILQPERLPDRLESGTINMPAVAGLLAAIHFLEERGGVNASHNRKKDLVQYFFQLAQDIPRIQLYLSPEEIQTGVISFNIKGMDAGEIAQKLADKYQIMSRAGLQCSPLSHQAFQTFPEGTIRFSFSPFNTEMEIEQAIEALKEIIND